MEKYTDIPNRGMGCDDARSCRNSCLAFKKGTTITFVKDGKSFMDFLIRCEELGPQVKFQLSRFIDHA